MEFSHSTFTAGSAFKEYVSDSVLTDAFNPDLEDSKVFARLRNVLTAVNTDVMLSMSEDNKRCTDRRSLCEPDSLTALKQKSHMHLELTKNIMRDGTNIMRVMKNLQKAKFPSVSNDNIFMIKNMFSEKCLTLSEGKWMEQ